MNSNSILDEIFFEKILRRSLENETIKNVRIESQVPAVEKGANFLSQLWKFVLKYDSTQKIVQRTTQNLKEGKNIWRRKEMKLIVKCEPVEKGPCSILIEDQNIFHTEILIFDSILPKFERILNQKLSPKYFRPDETENGKFSCLVMEDLQALGFSTKNRQIGLSHDYVVMVLEAIADFHAASVWLTERDPGLTRRFTEGIITEKTPLNMIRAIEQSIGMIVEKFRNSIDNQIHEKFAAIVKNFYLEILQVTSYEQDEFCVLNHGDCWVNNLMFREDETGKPLEIILIDYQMCVYSSPVIDLLYFLGTCPSQDIRTELNDYFIDKYVQRLTERMKNLGCETRAPTIEDLRRSIAKRRMWIILSEIGFYPRMIADSSEIESFDELLETGQTRMNLFKNPNAEIAIKKTLLDMDRRGYLQ